MSQIFPKQKLTVGYSANPPIYLGNGHGYPKFGHTMNARQKLLSGRATKGIFYLDRLASNELSVSEGNLNSDWPNDIFSIRVETAYIIEGENFLRRQFNSLIRRPDQLDDDANRLRQ